MYIHLYKETDNNGKKCFTLDGNEPEDSLAKLENQLYFYHFKARGYEYHSTLSDDGRDHSFDVRKLLAHMDYVRSEAMYRDIDPDDPSYESWDDLQRHFEDDFYQGD